MRYGLKSSGANVIPRDVGLGITVKRSASAGAGSGSGLVLPTGYTFKGWAWAAQAANWLATGQYELTGVLRRGHSLADGDGTYVTLPIEGTAYWLTLNAIIEGADYSSISNSGLDVAITTDPYPSDLEIFGMGCDPGDRHAITFASWFVNRAGGADLEPDDAIRAFAESYEYGPLGWSIYFEFTLT